MAKQKQNPEIHEAEIVSAEIVTIVPGKSTGKAPVLFTPDKTDELVKLFINSEVLNFDASEADVAELIVKHKKKKVKDAQDVKGYEAVKSAYQELVKMRTSTDKKRAELGKPYSSIKAGIDKHAKENIIGALAAEEARLKAEKDKFEKWEKEEKERKEREAAELLKKRIDELKQAGLVFDGELYTIGEISVDVVTVQKMSETDYSFLLAKVEDAAEKIAALKEQERLEKEKKDREARELQEENERKARELFAEKLDMRREQLEAAGFTDSPEHERFYLQSLEGGKLWFIEYAQAVDMPAAEFKAEISKIKAEQSTHAELVEESKEAAPEANDKLDPDAARAAVMVEGNAFVQKLQNTAAEYDNLTAHAFKSLADKISRALEQFNEEMKSI